MLIQNEIPKEIDDDEKFYEWRDRSNFWAIDIDSFSRADILNFSIDPDHIPLTRFLANGGVKWIYDGMYRYMNLKEGLIFRNEEFPENLQNDVFKFLSFQYGFTLNESDLEFYQKLHNK